MHPRQEGEDLVFGDADLQAAPGDLVDWNALVTQHQWGSIEGDEPGGMVSGEEWAPQAEVLRG